MQPELLEEVLEMLRGSAAAAASSGGSAAGTTSLQVEQMCRVMRQWGQVNGILL